MISANADEQTERLLEAAQKMLGVEDRERALSLLLSDADEIIPWLEQMAALRDALLENPRDRGRIQRAVKRAGSTSVIVPGGMFFATPVLAFIGNDRFIAWLDDVQNAAGDHVKLQQLVEESVVLGISNKEGKPKPREAVIFIALILSAMFPERFFPWRPERWKILAILVGAEKNPKRSHLDRFLLASETLRQLGPLVRKTFGVDNPMWLLAGLAARLNARDKGLTASDSDRVDSQTSKENEDTEMKDLADILVRFKNVVLEGVPGTGKTWVFNQLAAELEKIEGKGWVENKQAITFHPSTSYEDFVEGLRPASNQVGKKDETTKPKVRVKDAVSGGQRFFFDRVRGDDDGWQVEDGFFLRICVKAARNPGKKYLVLLDELNRANVPKVMGDLLTTMENSKRARCKKVEKDEVVWEVEQSVTLPYSKRIFFVPENVYVIATMNTTDRSVARLDAALRRRFVFKRLEPMTVEDLTAALNKGKPQTKDNPEVKTRLETEVKRWGKLNEHLVELLGPDAMLGHSYFFGMKEMLLEDDKKEHDKIVSLCWELDILPQLVEILNMTRPGDDVLEKFMVPLRKTDYAADLNLTIKKDGKGLLECYVVAPPDPPKKQGSSTDNRDSTSSTENSDGETGNKRDA